jgi:glycosyltransferase involved in cell wall biosynthesis
MPEDDSTDKDRSKRTNLMKPESITMMVAAYNEEKHLRHAVVELDNVLKGLFEDYEILIFDDHSTDRTGQIADDLAKQHHNVKVIHNKRNSGLGYNYRKAIQLAKKDYFSFIPGDDAIKSASIKRILQEVGKVDMVIPFTANTKVRPLTRRIISRLFTGTLNILFGLKLKYYNGIVVHKTKLIKKIRMSTDSFAYQAEILIKLIRRGHTYKEVPMYINIEEKTSMFRFKNILGVILTVTWMFFKIRIIGIFSKERALR